MELSLTDVRVGPVVPTLGGGRRAAQEVVDRDLTAVVAYNDLVGVGLLRGLQALGVKVPAGRLPQQRHRLGDGGQADQLGRPARHRHGHRSGGAARAAVGAPGRAEGAGLHRAGQGRTR